MSLAEMRPIFIILIGQLFLLIFLVILQDAACLGALTDLGLLRLFRLNQILAKKVLFGQALLQLRELKQVSFDLLFLSLAQFVVVGWVQGVFQSIGIVKDFGKDAHD